MRSAARLRPVPSPPPFARHCSRQLSWVRAASLRSFSDVRLTCLTVSAQYHHHHRCRRQPASRACTPEEASRETHVRDCGMVPDGIMPHTLALATMLNGKSIRHGTADASGVLRQPPSFRRSVDPGTTPPPPTHRDRRSLDGIPRQPPLRRLAVDSPPAPVLGVGGGVPTGQQVVEKRPGVVRHPSMKRLLDSRGLLAIQKFRHARGKAKDASVGVLPQRAVEGRGPVEPIITGGGPRKQQQQQKIRHVATGNGMTIPIVAVPAHPVDVAKTPAVAWGIQGSRDILELSTDEPDGPAADARVDSEDPAASTAKSKVTSASAAAAAATASVLTTVAATMTTTAAAATTATTMAEKFRREKGKDGRDGVFSIHTLGRQPSTARRSVDASLVLMTPASQPKHRHASEHSRDARDGVFAHRFDRRSLDDLGSVALQAGGRPAASATDARGSLKRRPSRHSRAAGEDDNGCPGVLTAREPHRHSSVGSLGGLSDSDRHASRSELDTSGELVFQAGVLVGGYLPALVDRLVPTGDFPTDKSLAFTVLLCGRLFAPPHDLAALLSEASDRRWHSEELRDEAKRRRFGWHMSELLSEWRDTFPRDFEDLRVAQLLAEVSRRVVGHAEEADRFHVPLGCPPVPPTPGLPWEVPSLDRLSLHCIAAPDSASSASSAPSAEPTTAKVGASGVLSVGPCGTWDLAATCADPYTLAQQLTGIELERMNDIGPEEFMQAIMAASSSSKQADGEENKGPPKVQSPPLEVYVDWFNRLTYLVATEICVPGKKKQRARVMEFFIDVARECLNLGNFNSLMAIITGMNMSPVARLKKTWSHVNTDKFQILEHHMDPTSNFCNYRTALRAAAQRAHAAQSDREKIVIPFFSLLLKDIYFLNESSPSLLPSGHLNVEKLQELTRQVREFVTWRRARCPYPSVPSVRDYLQHAPVYHSEEALQVASYESESPENQTEKERLKSLRSMLT
uniref:Uncharacterized protein LOC116944481 isoform X2 n=1 Tax=Petromyzon marinus TaxID=7757 RepID=A0AAJ7TA19_PETMA|nr:uncharacterized protein LOC116944481 isoform X2 [Petromyzon marinus]